MGLPRLSKLELQIMEAFWTHGACSVREVQESFPEKNRPAFTTVQTMIYRLEEKKAVRRVKKIGNAHVFEAAITRKSVYRRVVSDLLDFFGGSATPLMEHLVESGKLSLADIRAAEMALEKKR